MDAGVFYQPPSYRVARREEPAHNSKLLFPPTRRRAPEHFSIAANTLQIAVKEKVLNNWCFHRDLTLPPSRIEATPLPDGKDSVLSNCFGCRVPPVRRALAAGQFYFCNARREGFPRATSKLDHHHVIQLRQLSLSSIRPPLACAPPRPQFQPGPATTTKDSINAKLDRLLEALDRMDTRELLRTFSLTAICSVFTAIEKCSGALRWVSRNNSFELCAGSSRRATR